MLLQSYVANDVFLQVLCDPACYPYSYVENGEMKGIVPAYFRRVAASIGLPYQFVICRSREEWLAYRNRGAAISSLMDAWMRRMSSKRKTGSPQSRT